MKRWQTVLLWLGGLLLALAVVRAATIRYDMHHPHPHLRPTGSPWDDRTLYDCSLRNAHAPSYPRLVL